MYYMGIDHHKQYSHITILDATGKIIKKGNVSNYRRDLEVFLQELEEKMIAVIEAGRSTYTMVDVMEEMGVEVKIAHPAQVLAIAKAKIKTDERGSRMLAHLLRSDLIPEVYRRDEKNRSFQRVLRHRINYVRLQTRIKNQIRSLLAQQREEVREMIKPGEQLFRPKGILLLKQLEIPETDRQLLDALLETLLHLQGKIRHSDQLVNQLYNNSEEAKLISTIPGFGRFLSVLVATEICDVKRFSSASKLHSYAGLIPSTYSSGQRHYHGKLVREGDKWLRWAVVEAVWPAIRSDYSLYFLYHRMRKRKGANQAKIVVARRLLTIIFKVLKEKRAFILYKKKSAAFIGN